MPRISQDQTQERHEYLLELFRNQPDLSSKEALNSFKGKFGATISPKTLNELREQAQGGLDTAGGDEEPAEVEAPTATQEAASRMQASFVPDHISSQPKAAKAKGARQKNVFVDASKEQLVFLERIVQQLQEAGASNVRIDHSTDRWMVLVVDAK
ncbi:MAG TPA: hypothetical protein VK420_19435 [Longimicrobium sp.]|nr:hypothetical protein [Longimicrobium sp.]